jgi:hypothetical protein
MWHPDLIQYQFKYHKEEKRKEKILRERFSAVDPDRLLRADPGFFLQNPSTCASAKASATRGRSGLLL